METQKTLRWKPTMPAFEDERDLLARARGGDATARDDLVRAHYSEIRRAARHLLGNADDAQDLAQDCFVKALGSLARFRGQASFRGWLRRILVSLARDRFRSRARRPAWIELPAALASARPEASPPGEAGRAELARLVEEALRALPASLRVPLVLRALEGWGYEEIAHACGVTAATARTQVMKARKRLHERIASAFEDGEDGR